MDMRLASALACGVCVVAIAAPASAQTRTFNIPSGSLKEALDAFGRQSGRPIIYQADQIRGARSAGARGDLSVDAALRAILAGTGFHAQEDASGAVAIVTTLGSESTEGETAASLGEGNAGSAPADDKSADIVVTGTRLGVPLASPVRNIGRQEIENGGFSNLGDAIRALPQNFAGGQNPGVYGSSAGGIANQNITNGTSVNLRGLGPDATLTLFNGHRLSYAGFTQGVDISAIPLAAIDHVDVVADGASAIYGSDAVAGVVNVVLRRSFSGLTASAQLGTSTDGGATEQQYDLVTGSKWSSGGFIATYSYDHRQALDAVDRDYTAYMGSPFAIIPGEDKHSAILSAHQSLADSISAKIDVLYNQRVFPNIISLFGETLNQRSRDENYSISPEIDVGVGANWLVRAGGTYGRDVDRAHEHDVYGGATIYENAYCYCNTIESGEISASGNLVSLAAGDVKMSVGGGYRRETFLDESFTSGSRFGGSDEDAYAFGELYIPIMANRTSNGRGPALAATAALRYEHYNRFGDVATPKLGLIYSPDRIFDLKISWGQSFKAPTLAQQYQPKDATLIDATLFPGLNAPAGSTALYVEGGSDQLKPERSTNLSATIAAHPEAVKGLNLQLSYYRILYSQRVIEPIGQFTNAFNPAYAEFVELNPTVADQSSAIAVASGGLQFYGVSSYDPSKVVGLIRNYYTNVARQRIEGADISISYRNPSETFPISFLFDGSWLRSRQQNSQATDFFDLAGSVYNPPHLRARAGLGWDARHLKAFIYFNYLGGVLDNRQLPATDGASMETFDLTLRYLPKVPSRLLRDVELSFSVQNLFNARAPYLAPLATYYLPFDSSNYSAIGRFVRVSLAKHF